jgi:NADH-quinone oxidoreductase subunit N
VLVFIALINTVISLYYYLLVVKAMFINQNENPIEKFTSDGYMKVSLVICLIGLVILGFTSGIYQNLTEISFGL